jgi:ankyrin repeat protein
VARCNENTDVSSNPAADSAASSGSGDLDLDCGVVAAADESEHWAILRLYKDLLSFYSDEESVRDTISPGTDYAEHSYNCMYLYRFLQIAIFAEVRLAIGMLPTENSERYNWTSEDEEGFDQDFAAAMSASEHASGGAASSSSRVVSAAQGAGRGAGGPGAGGISSEDGDDDEGYDDEDEDGDDGEGEFDPSSKRFSPLNFKDPASLERYLSATGDKFSYEMHMKRKLKNAKKKAEQRRKQKERRLREAAEKEEEAARQREREAELARQAEEAQRLRREEQRRAQELEAERRKQLFAAASRGDLDALKAMLESPGVNLRVTERINENGRSGSGLLHAVFAGVQVQPEDGQIVFSIADRVTLARYLLSMKAPSIDLGVLDEEGCNVLHIAAKVGQLPFVNTILDNRSESQEKRNQLDLNARCLHKGFTALHYAADAGHYDICEKLVDIGVLLNVHASCNKHKSEETSNSKGPTPLEIVKTKLELPSLPTSERQNYERVAEKISSALLKLERAKLAREQERQAREAKQRAEKEAQLLKEQKERELLERKQKLLREKQEKLGKQDAASQQQQQQQQRDDAASAEAPAVDSKKKKKDQKEKQPSLSEQKEEAKESKTISETMSTPQKKGTKAPNLSADARKDLCRHLMSMGFAESDCVAAIDACGANVEAAISWICDRPKGGGVSRPTPETSLEANVKASLAPSLSAPQSSAAQKPTVQEEEALALKLQREKEKLREINRKWNAKVPQQRAEEERKRVSGVLHPYTLSGLFNFYVNSSRRKRSCARRRSERSSPSPWHRTCRRSLRTGRPSSRRRH